MCMRVQGLGPTCKEGSSRFTKTGHTYTPIKTKDYERIKRAAWADDYKPTSQRVNVIVGSYMEIPKSAQIKRLECQSGIC